jgi:hypothetical protein
VQRFGCNQSVQLDDALQVPQLNPDYTFSETAQLFLSNGPTNFVECSAHDAIIQEFFLWTGFVHCGIAQ